MKRLLLMAGILLVIAALGILGYEIFFHQDSQALSENNVKVMDETPSPLSLSAQTPEPTPDPRVLKESETLYDKGCELLASGLFAQAREYLRLVQVEDRDHYQLAQERLSECLTGIKTATLSKAQLSYDKAHFKEAQVILQDALNELPGDREILDLLNSAKDAASNLVKYEGPIYHIFFHSLIVYPELCFTGDAMTQGYNAWMTTVYEFKAMLPELYDRSYVLVDLSDLFKTDDTGKMILNDLYLPKGTKPLVISIDNVSYEDYRVDDGFAKRLVLDDNGEVATLVKTPGGSEIVTRDGDVIPILDDFVKYHPDFSFENAKGTIALNGFQGILGYRTNHSNLSWEQEREEAQKVVDKLKSNGWTFANHSYSHTRKFSERTLTLEGLQYDTEKWLDEVGSITGPTNIYVAPFGTAFASDGPLMQYIVSQGYAIYCVVGNRAYYELNDGYVYMERIDLDGYKMNHSRKALAPLIDIEKVYDPARPPLE